jgi:predicted nucleic acid-binding protein
VVSATWCWPRSARHSSNGSDALQLLEDAASATCPIESKAALRAGEMQRRYRQRGGRRERTMADFLVGAHALIAVRRPDHRDAGFFRDYFKGLKVIVPQA